MSSGGSISDQRWSGWEYTVRGREDSIPVDWVERVFQGYKATPRNAVAGWAIGHRLTYRRIVVEVFATSAVESASEPETLIDMRWSVVLIVNAISELLAHKRLPSDGDFAAKPDDMPNWELIRE
ncbi:hypothetical protein [Paludisphaera rhizosphaerae]|uniref:hypothetical protein n=1 Tax=Paludisphaera rhizosphaerae TaxID=2711216 RepID=UPI0013EA9054|nr:hypothetical protein [Paludisphaera rhizosphaerae]